MSIKEIRNKALYLFSKNVLKEIYNIQNAIIKGGVLSNLCYNNPNERFSNDIDILLPRHLIKKADEILVQNGFAQKSINPAEKRKNQILCLSASHQTLPYSKCLDNYLINIDLNFDIFWGEYKGKRVDMDEFLSDIIEMDIYGIKVKTLPPLKAMVQLILHHYKDMNSIFLLATRKSIKYDMFKDVYYLLKNNLTDISLAKLYSMSAEYEIIPYVYYVLYYTGKIYDDEILKEYIEAFKTPEGKTLLNCYGLNAAERREWKYDFQTRLESDSLYELIKDNLTYKDIEKIALNKKVFMGE